MSDNYMGKVFITGSQVVEAVEDSGPDTDLETLKNFLVQLNKALSVIQSEGPADKESSFIKQAIWVTKKAIIYKQILIEKQNAKGADKLLIDIVRTNQFKPDVHYRWYKANLIPYVVTEGDGGRDRLLKIFEELTEGIKLRHNEIWGD